MSTALVVMMTADEARERVNQINSEVRGIGALLLDLKEREGWKALGYSTWTECLEKEFEESRRHLYRLMNAEEVRRDLGPIGHIDVSQVPESQLRELVDVPSEERVPVYQESVETAPEGRVTAAHIQRTKEVREQKRAQKKTAPSGYACRSDGTLIPDARNIYVGDLSELVSARKRYGCIYADPPWLYDNQVTRAATGNHYDGLTVEEICQLPVRELAADDSHLHLWVTNAFLFEAPKIFDAWGFAFKSTFVWVKPQFGIGNYWRNSHEILLTAVRGDATRFKNKSLKSWLECGRGAHSSKPDQVREFIQKASGGPYLELFGRRVVNGWTVFGDQIESSLFAPAVEVEA